MSRSRAAACVCAVAVLFLIVNRAAYQGFLSGDEIDAIEWTSRAAPGIFLRGLATPFFNPDNFRPVGHGFFWLFGRAFGLRFEPYLAAVQALHLAAAALVFLLARRLGATVFAASLGSLFFLFHMAVFDAFWKSMYVFDILCAVFVCLSLLAWRKEGWRWWIVSFVCFWLAYKSKEVAVMLPAVLAAYEGSHGSRRWPRLAPFFLVSLSFGLQALLANPTGEYHLALTPRAFAATAGYYASHLFVWPVGIVAAAAIAAPARDRFGFAAALLFLVPMLALPGRTTAVYLYVPLAFVSLTVASAAQRAPRTAAALMGVWLALNFLEMRRLRNPALAEANKARAYFTTAEANRERLRRAAGFRFDGYPGYLNSWGAEATVRWLVSKGELPAAKGNELVLSWQPGESKLYLFDQQPVSFLDMETGTPIRSHETGWLAPEPNFRWTEPVARLRLARPSAAASFECEVFVPPQLLMAAGGKILLALFLDEQLFATFSVETPGWHTFHTRQLPPPSLGPVDVTLRVTPPFGPGSDGRSLGIPVGAIGFR